MVWMPLAVPKDPVLDGLGQKGHLLGRDVTPGEHIFTFLPHTRSLQKKASRGAVKLKIVS